MRKLLVGVFSFLVFQLPGSLRAQQPGTQSASETASCDSLSQIVSDDVRRAASSLHVCHNLERILARRGISSSQSLQNFVAQVQSEAGADANAQPNQDEQAKQQDLQDRQRMTEALNRRAVETNLLLLRSHTALLELQTSKMNAEQRAYRRTKILNALLGTTVGVIGSGMQFSNSTSVQHAGDGVSIAGGAITAIFALCTADIDVIDTPPDESAAQAFQNNNQQHVIPDMVWSFMMSDPGFNELRDVAPHPKPLQGKALSCHWKQAPKNKSLAENLQFFKALENNIARMSQADAELARLAALQ